MSVQKQFSRRKIMLHFVLHNTEKIAFLMKKYKVK